MGQQVTKGAKALAHVYEDEESVPEVEEAIVETEHQISVSREVVSTELSYVSSLETCIQRYLVPMKQFAEEHPQKLSPAEVRMIFVNIEEIAEIHRQFLHDLKEVKSTLEQRMEYDEEDVADVLPEKSRKSRRRLYPKWFKISRKSLKRDKEREETSSPRKPTEDGLVRPCFGPLFLKHADKFRCYTNFVNNYNDATSTLLHCQARSPELASMLYEIKMDPDVNHDLAAFLIMPVQRIPRYIMLLSELLKDMNPRHPDHGPSTEALRIIKEIAEFINEEKRIAENMNHILEIENRLTQRNREQSYVTLVKRDRTLLSRTTLECKNCTKKKRRRRCHFLLFNDLILIASEMPNRIRAIFSKEEKFAWKERDRCDLVEVELDTNDSDDGLELQTGLRTQNAEWIIYFETEEEKNRWDQTMKDTIRACVSARIASSKAETRKASTRPTSTVAKTHRDGDGKVAVEVTNANWSKKADVVIGEDAPLLGRGGAVLPGGTVDATNAPIEQEKEAACCSACTVM